MYVYYCTIKIMCQINMEMDQLYMVQSSHYYANSQSTGVFECCGSADREIAFCTATEVRIPFRILEPHQ
jgi:hypothetical protein